MLKAPTGVGNADGPLTNTVNHERDTLKIMAPRVKRNLAATGPDTYRSIENRGDFLEAVDMALREREVALDLEADSMYHFRERVCLIQMAFRDRIFIIDPLTIRDMSPLKTLFYDPDIKKVLHGADYDVRSLYRDFDIDIRNLFDTQIACRFLGIQETGLDTVLKKRFNLKLNKKYQKKDWSKRPLPKNMVAYAAGDVSYLLPLAHQLENELSDLNRLSWVQEESELLSKVRPANENNEPLFLKFKGAGRLRPRGLAVLEALLQSRRQIAERKDRPLFKIIGNDAVLKISKARPVTLKRLEGIRALSAKQISMFGEELIRAVTEAMALPKHLLPEYPRKRPPAQKPKVPKRVQAIRIWRDKTAEKFDLDPAVLCNKALMTAIAARNPHRMSEFNDIEDMRNWQKENFGEEILAALRKNR